jgi:molybdenum cofactor cytidylyltransferase
MTINETLLSTRAYSNLISLPPEQHRLIGKALLQLQRNPELGFRLWGRDDLYLYETGVETKVIYRLCGQQLQVLAIKAAPEHYIPSRARISAVILAAGRTAYGDSPPIAGITESLLTAGIDDVIVVLGYHAEQAKKYLYSKDVKIIVNPDYKYGLSKSLRYGLKIVSRDTAAVLLTLGNCPLVKAEVVKQLIRTYKSRVAPIIVPTYSHIRGHPVVFDTLLIPELLRVRGDIGGRSVLQHHNRELKQVEVEDADTLRNVN